MRGILLLIWMMIALAAFSQKQTYTRIISSPGYDEGVAAFRMPNKEIRLIANTSGYGHGATDIWYIALDSNGDFLWQKFYGTKDIEKAVSALMTPTGDIFIVGTTTQDFANTYQVYLLGLDPYGQIICSNSYGGSNWDFGYDICMVSDSIFALTGETFSYGNGQSDAYVLLVNRQGDTLWTKTCGGALEDRANAIKLLSDSSLLIAGATKSFGNGTFDFYVVNMNQSGGLNWQKTFTRRSDAEFNDFVVKPDSSIVLTGYIKDTNNTYHDIALLELNANGDSLWDRSKGLSNGSEVMINSILRRSNGEFILGGSSSYQPTSDARVLRVDYDGWFQSANFFGLDNKDDFGHKLTADTFHGKYFFIIGTTADYGLNRTGVYFIRFDTNLYADTTRMIFLPTAISGAEPQNADIRIYPNPATDRLKIAFSGNHSAGRIEVYAMNGRLLKSQVFYAHTKQQYIDLIGLPSAVYLIRIRTKSDLYQYKLIKQ